MRGRLFTTGGLTEDDLHELADELAIRIGSALGPKVVLLGREDIAELINQYIGDLIEVDQNTVIWLIWHLFKEAAEIYGGD